MNNKFSMLLIVALVAAVSYGATNSNAGPRRLSTDAAGQLASEAVTLVPDLSRMALDQAELILRRYGLVLGERRQVVAEQDPTPSPPSIRQPGRA